MQRCTVEGLTGVNSLSESGQRRRTTFCSRSMRPRLIASTSSTSHAGEPDFGCMASMADSLRHAYPLPQPISPFSHAHRQPAVPCRVTHSSQASHQCQPPMLYGGPGHNPARVAQQACGVTHPSRHCLRSEHESAAAGEELCGQPPTWHTPP